MIPQKKDNTIDIQAICRTNCTVLTIHVENGRKAAGEGISFVFAGDSVESGQYF